MVSFLNLIDAWVKGITHKKEVIKLVWISFQRRGLCWSFKALDFSPPPESINSNLTQGSGKVWPAMQRAFCKLKLSDLGSYLASVACAGVVRGRRWLVLTSMGCLEIPLKWSHYFIYACFDLAFNSKLENVGQLQQWGFGFWKKIASPVPVPLSSTLWASLPVCLLASFSTETISHLTLVCPGAACLLSNEGNGYQVHYIFPKLLQFPYHYHLYC